MKFMFESPRGIIVLTALLFTIPLRTASAQCDNKTGFAKQLCELSSRLPAKGPGDKGAASTTSVPAGHTLATGLPDAIHPHILDPSVSPKAFKPLLSLDRSDDGSFILKRGSYEAYVESYFFDNSDNKTAQIGAFFPAPIKGARATSIAAVLKLSELHPEIKQAEVQQLLSAIFASVDLEKMPLQVQQTAVTILPRDVAKQLQSAARAQKLGQDAISVLGQRMSGFPRSKPNPQTQSNALPSPQPPVVPDDDVDAAGDTADLPVARGTWAQMPGGFYVRYLPDNCSRIRLQVIVPDAAMAEADAAHPLTFDPTQYLAILAQAPGQRLGITVRQIETPKR
jgi:hypothetical protein